MDWVGLKRFLARRRLVEKKPGSFSVEVEMHRADEVRSWVKDAPSEDELDGIPHDPWRPAKTLGLLPKK